MYSGHYRTWTFLQCRLYVTEQSIILPSIFGHKITTAVLSQGCQMVYFQIKNLNLGSFWSVLQWKMCVYFWDIWSISQPFCLSYGNLVTLVVIWYIFPRFGMLYQEKSGNPVLS
jgi:hypothetical protein